MQQERLPNGRLRFACNGHYLRTIVTKLATIPYRVQRVLDNLSGDTFSPLLEALKMRRLRYTHDVRVACATEATRTSYGEAEQAFHKATGVRVPKRTIWNFVQELAPVVEAMHKADKPRAEDKVHLGDSTKVRSQAKGGQHEIHVAVTQDPETRRCEVVEVKVNGPARLLFEEKPTLLVTDDEASLRVVAAEQHQLCVRHFKKRVAFLLWKQDKASREERDHWVDLLAATLGRLEASVEKHREDGDLEALEKRVQQTLVELKGHATKLEKAGFPMAARFVRTEGRATVVFAELALRGVWMPSTTNGIERTMGTIADRCKRKWAHWGSGLRNLVLLLLIRKTRPGVYTKAEARYLKGVRAS